MSEFPLSLEEKEDYPGKLNALSGTDSKYYESAEEKNKKTRALNELDERVKTIQTGTSLYSVANATEMTAKWNELNDSGTPPEDGRAEIFRQDLNQFWKWNSALTAKAEFSRGNIKKADVIESGNEDVAVSGDVADYVDEKEKSIIQLSEINLMSNNNTFYNTNNIAVADTYHGNTTVNSNLISGVLDCKEGDTFFVKLSAITTGRAWVFVDENNEVISFAGEDWNTYENAERLIAPADASKVYFNHWKGSTRGYPYVCKISDYNLNTENQLKRLDKPKFITPVSLDQIRPEKWVLTSGGSNNVHGDIVINKGVQSKLQITNPTTIGSKYIAIGYLFNPVKINANVTGLDFYNGSQKLFNLSLDAPNLNYAVFESNQSSVIQLLVTGDLSSSNDGDSLCSFTSSFMTVIPWNQDLEDICKSSKENYIDGRLEFTQSFLSIGNQDILKSDSFEEITDFASILKDKLPTHITKYNSITGVSNLVNEVQDNIFLFKGDVDYTVASAKMRTGYKIDKPLFASEDKNYVIIIKGTLQAVNCANLNFQTGENSVNVNIAQDVVDNSLTNIESIVEISYPAGYAGTRSFAFFNPTRFDANIDEVSIDLKLEVFSIFEKIEDYTLQDYINASKDGFIVANNIPKKYADKDYVSSQISNLLNNTSKLTANDLVFKSTVELILSGGQSLNLGGNASNTTEDFKNTLSFAGGSTLLNRNFTTQAEKDAYFGTDLVLLKDNFANEQFVPATTVAHCLIQQIQNENNTNLEDYKVQFLPFAWGVSGAGILSHVKGTTAYSNMLEVVTKAKQLSNKQGKDFCVRIAPWIHGEADRDKTKQFYYDTAFQLFTDMNTDIKAITGQTFDIKFFLYQTSGWLGREASGVTRDNINIQEAQLQLAIDKSNIYLSNPMYQFNYSDDYHPSDRAVVGLSQFPAYKKVVIDGGDWKTFRPISHEVKNFNSKYYTYLKFEANYLPIKFNVSGYILANPRGKQTNFGFELLDGTTELQIEEPFIVKGDTVVLVSTANPNGKKIRYAVNGHAGGGNLCDNQQIPVKNKGVDYLVSNFAVSFSEYIID